MDVRFISTTSARLPDIPIIEGQLIYLRDINATYYDISSQRNPISGFHLVNRLPDNGQPHVIYGVINSSGKVDASIWDTETGSFKPMTGYIATSESVGLVKPDGDTITISEDGTITAVTHIDHIPASSVTYDNSESGMEAENAQAAIDELSTGVNDAAYTASTALNRANSASSAASEAGSAAQEASNEATAASNAVVLLEGRVQTLESKVQTLESKVQTLESKVQTLESVEVNTIIK